MKTSLQASISLPQDILDWVKEEALRLRCSSSYVIRLILVQEMERRKQTETK